MGRDQHGGRNAGLGANVARLWLLLHGRPAIRGLLVRKLVVHC